MQAIYFLAGLTAFISVIWCVCGGGLNKISAHPVILIVILGLAARILLLSADWGYGNDLALFSKWADLLFKNGFSRFYGSEGFIDYPPGYMYALYALGAVRGVFKLSGSSFSALLKMPAIICDILASCLIYRAAARKFRKNAALALGLAYALNPAILMDSVIWGQIDSIHTLLMVVSVSALISKRRLLSYAMLVAAVLVKPQSMTLAPIFIFEAAALLGKKQPPELKIKAAVHMLLMAAAAFCVAVLLILPFTVGWDFGPIVRLYLKTLKGYPYASVNAYNIFAFWGANWVSIDKEFILGISYGQAEFFSLALICIFAVASLYKARGSKSAWFLVSGAVFAFTFLLSVMMHERYLYPALIFLLAAYVYRPDKRIFMFYVLYSALFFVNCADVLYMVRNGNLHSLIEGSMQFVSLLNIIVTAALAVVAALVCFRRPAGDAPDLPAAKVAKAAPPEPSMPALALGRRDWLAMAALSLVFSIPEFYNLGDASSPQTAWRAGEGQYAEFELAKPVKTMMYMLGARNDKSFKLSASRNRRDWREIAEIKGKSVFRWYKLEAGFSEPYARLTSLDNDLFIQEVAFFDDDGQIVPIAASGGEGFFESEDPLISGGPSMLCDEQGLAPHSPSFMNGTYFDEIYHARTAYEFIHHLRVYEWTHPPLGKAIIAAGVGLFGMSPFGWRFAGALSGVLMIPVMYIFAKKMFNDPAWAFFAAFLYGVDFMRFTQTRIGTVDGFATIFIMLMYVSIYAYCSLNFFERREGFKHAAFAQSLVCLLFCGIFTGLAAAVKWEGIFAAVVLPMLVLHTLHARYLEFNYALASGAGGGGHWNIKYFHYYLAVTVVCCALFLVIVPALLYAAAYAPFLQTPNQHGLGSIIKNQFDMFGYHWNLESKHPYASRWFQWPFMLRPIYYYSGEAPNGLKMGITAFGNPAVWWGGIAALLHCFNVMSKKFDKQAFFLVAAYASQFLPWMFVRRTTYIYHYFPSVPFVVLMITFSAKKLAEAGGRLPALVFLAAAFLLFIAFYPALSGFPTSMRYVDAFLRWMPTWKLS